MDLIPSVIGLIGGMGAGIAYTMSGRSAKPASTSRSSSFSSRPSPAWAVLPVLIAGYVPMAPMQLAYLLLAGVAAAGGQFSVTSAYCFAPAREISVYDYTQVIFSAVLGFILFGQLPDGLSVLGYILICGTGVATFLYNRRQDRLQADSVKGR